MGSTTPPPPGRLAHPITTDMATEIKAESSLKLFFVNIFVSILLDAIY